MAASNGNRWRTVWPRSLAVAAFGIAAFWNTVFGLYCYDDTSVIADCEAINHPGALRWLVSAKYGPAFGELSYRPAVTASYFLDGFLFHKKPAATALINLALHVLAGIGLYRLWRGLFGREQLAFWAAALFLCHPIVSETVNCGGFREEILCLLFLTAALRCAGRALSAPEGRSAIGWAGGGAAAWFLALLSKETAAMGVALAPLLLFYAPPVRAAHARNASEFRRRTLGLLAAYGAALAFALALYFAFSFDALGAGWPGGHGPLLGFLNFCRAFLLYLRLWILPAGLSVGHEFFASATYADSRLWIGLGVFAVFLAISIGLCARGRLAGLGGIWIALTLLPVAQIVPAPELVAERFLYLPHAGFALLLAAGFGALAQRLARRFAAARKPAGRELFVRRAWMAIACAAAGAYIGLSINRNFDWSDDVTLNVRRYAAWKSAEGREALGVLNIHNDPALAERLLREALAMDENRPEALRALAALCARSGRIGEARSCLEQAAKLDPHNKETRRALEQLKQAESPAIQGGGAGS